MTRVLEIDGDYPIQSEYLYKDYEKQKCTVVIPTNIDHCPIMTCKYRAKTYKSIRKHYIQCHRTDFGEFLVVIPGRPRLVVPGDYSPTKLSFDLRSKLSLRRDSIFKRYCKYLLLGKQGAIESIRESYNAINGRVNPRWAKELIRYLVHPQLANELSSCLESTEDREDFKTIMDELGKDINEDGYAFPGNIVYLEAKPIRAFLNSATAWELIQFPLKEPLLLQYHVKTNKAYEYTQKRKSRGAGDYQGKRLPLYFLPFYHEIGDASRRERWGLLEQEKWYEYMLNLSIFAYSFTHHFKENFNNTFKVGEARSDWNNETLKDLVEVKSLLISDVIKEPPAWHFDRNRELIPTGDSPCIPKGWSTEGIPPNFTLEYEYSKPLENGEIIGWVNPTVVKVLWRRKHNSQVECPIFVKGGKEGGESIIEEQEDEDDDEIKVVKVVKAVVEPVKRRNLEVVEEENGQKKRKISQAVQEEPAQDEEPDTDDIQPNADIPLANKLLRFYYLDQLSNIN